MKVPSGTQPKPGPLARAASSEVRADIGRYRASVVSLARASGLSRNYLGKRLRDETPLTLNDIEAICAAFGEDLEQFLVKVARTAAKGK